MPVCIETCEKNISIISTAVIKEIHKCNGLQRKGQWPRPSSEAAYTKLVRSELNCLKTAPSLQHWLCKRAQAQGLWVPAAHWGGRDTSGQGNLSRRELQTACELQSFDFSCVRIESMGETTNKQTNNAVQRRETVKELPFSAAHIPQ